MALRYAVIGNPVAHSLSPLIHQEFARACAIDLQYERLPAPMGGFTAAVRAFIDAGGNGANVTVPFKTEACALADTLSERAKIAGAVNTLTFRNDHIIGDNTDGAGLVRDLTDNLHTPLVGKRILLIGAGGAARGVLQPLLAESPATLTVVNRTQSKAAALVKLVDNAALSACDYPALAGQSFDIVINATSASLQGELPPLTDATLQNAALAYDMMYGQALTPFLRKAQAAGATQLADGLGMLVEQAAEAFFIWHGVRPQTAPVLQRLKKQGGSQIK